MKKTLRAVCTGFIIINIISFSKASEAPNFALYDIKGKRNIFYNMVDSVSRDGIVIINFTSVYCKPCKKEIPELLSLKKNAGKRVKLLIIYSEGVKEAKKSASALGALKYAYADPLRVIHSRFNIKKVPVTVVIDKRHRILGRFEGYTEKNIKAIKRLVERR